MNERIKSLAKSVQKHPDDSFYKFALALELLKIDQTEKAKVLFESIYNEDPEYVGVYYHLGKLYETIGNENDAIKMYEAGIKMAEALNEQHAKSELSEALFSLEIELNDQ